MTADTSTLAQTDSPPVRVRLLAELPERLVLIVVALALSAGLWVSLGAHHWWTVLPTAAALAAAAWRPLAPRRAVSDAGVRRAAMAAAIAVAGVVVWSVVNIAMAAEYLLVVRDPGFLTLSGLWLVEHPSTDIPAAGAVEAASVSGTMLSDASEAWNRKGDVIQPQGAKMLPATIAIGGWVAGTTGVLSANVVIGAAGILAVFAVARRFLSPLAALAPAGALALTVSHIGLSRPAYSEPLTLVLVFAAVMWGWQAIQHRSASAAVAAAVTSGATTLVRIDGAAFAVGTLVGVVVGLALADAPRAWRCWTALTFVAVQASVLVAGYASMITWSTAYFERLSDEAWMLLTVYGAAAIVSVAWAATWTARMRGDRLLGAVADALGRRGALVAGGAVVAMFVVLISRPLWMTTHRGTETSRDNFTNGVVEGFQRSHGHEIDPTRTYGESTMTWLSYYLTWPLVILGAVGFGFAMYRMIRRQPAWAVFLCAVLAPSLLYLVRPSIVPDQLWAIRRLEPATLPGFLLAAAAAIWALAALARTPGARYAWRRIGAVLCVALPVTTWISIVPSDPYPVASAVNVTTREMIGAREQLDDLCGLAPGHPIVLVGTSSHYGSLRVTCDVPLVLELGEPDAEDLAEVARIWGAQPVVLTRSLDAVPWAETPQVVVSSEVRHSAYALQRLPRSLTIRTYDWYAGLVAEDGRVEPLEPSPLL